MPARVALVKGEDRYSNIRKALQLIQEDIHLEGIDRIFIKPNLTSVSIPLATTHVAALRALLGFLRERTSAPILVAEGSGTGSPPVETGFRNFGYQALEDEFGVELVDLNADTGVQIQVFDARLRPTAIKVSKTLLEAPYRISICPPKTHDAVLITASLKNMVMAGPLRKQEAIVEKVLSWASGHVPRAILRSPWLTPLRAGVQQSPGNYKLRIHQGYPAMNLNLFLLARLLRPHLAVIDGFLGMEGEGPVTGREVRLRLALASVDSVAADAVVARIMGLDPRQIGYLYYCHRAGLGVGDLEHISVLGERLEDHLHPFQLHPSAADQLNWQHPVVEDILAREGVRVG
jgi:uncharacterized protein (DUF362 family)